MKDTLNVCVGSLGHSITRFPWTDSGAYAVWLAQTYYYVRHSTRLLAASAARFSHDERGTALHSRFSTHMGEEKRHELLCVHDLKHLGAPIEKHKELHATRMFYEPQYYKVEHLTPLALFGYILPLEAIGPYYGKDLIDPLMRAHGESCVSFMKLHAGEDVEHLNKALQLMSGLSLNERSVVEENMLQTTHAYLFLLEEIRRRDGTVSS
jgi:Iron-containing redox enzyme